MMYMSTSNYKYFEPRNIRKINIKLFRIFGLPKTIDDGTKNCVLR